jgi:1-deoxy-D-xylulose-5-phosphate synthase
LAIGRGRIVRDGGSVAIVSFGARLEEALKAADELTARGYAATVADARFAKPLDHDLLRQLARHHRAVLTVEEGSIGGFGSHVQQFLLEEGLLDSGRTRLRSLVLPDRFIEQGTPSGMYQEAGLNAAAIVRRMLDAVGHDRPAARAATAPA